MSKEEETVFEEMNRHLDEIHQELVTANEALIVVAIELYDAKRDLTDIFKKMNVLLAKMAEAEVPVVTKEVSAVQDEERFKGLVFPSSKLSEKREEAE